MTIYKFIENYASKSPNKISLIYNTKEISYERLWQCISNWQKKLKVNGFSSGDKVIIKIDNQLDFVIAFLSFLSIECWVIPTPTDITIIELQKIINFTDAKVFDDAAFNIIDTYDINEIIEFKSPNPNYSGIYHLTSGTTGEPKLCIRTLECLTEEGISYNESFNIKSHDRITSVSPLYHSFAMGAALMSTMVSGASLYINDKFIPRKVLKLIQKEKISFLVLIPDMAKALCTTYSEQEFDLSSLRIALVGAGAITEELYNEFIKKYNIPLLSNYGSTETGGLISRLEPMPFKSIGKPMYGVEIRICTENGKAVRVGEDGEVRVKCSGMLKGYYKDNCCITDKNGFFQMGDIAVQDENGYIYIKGRKKSLIKVGGRSVNPYEVEEVILTFPGVKECVVIGSQSVSGEENIKAIIVGSGIKDNELRKYCIDKLSSYKIPTLIDYKESLPKNKLGKIKREELT